jgi:hypothetical protein
MKANDYEVKVVKYSDKVRSILQISAPNTNIYAVEVTDLPTAAVVELQALLRSQRAATSELITKIGAQWKSFKPEKLEILND